MSNQAVTEGRDLESAGIPSRNSNSGPDANGFLTGEDGVVAYQAKTP